MAFLIRDIGLLAGIHAGKHALRGESLSTFTSFSDAFLLIEGREISDFGFMRDMPHFVCFFAYRGDGREGCGDAMLVR